MTAQPAFQVIEGGTRRPVRLEVDRAELVERFMEAQALAASAIDANGYALQQVLRLPAGPWRSDLQRAHHEAHDRLVALISELRMAVGHFDGLALTRE